LTEATMARMLTSVNSLKLLILWNKKQIFNERLLT